MNKLEYRKYLRSPHWQNVKSRYYRTHEYICVRCGWRRGLQLHHTTYKRVGRERMTDLIYLCRKCHMADHGIGVMVNRKKLSWMVKVIIFSFIVGMLIQMWFYRGR